eukprot:3185030-Prymnesium_polylepis.1
MPPCCNTRAAAQYNNTRRGGTPLHKGKSARCLAEMRAGRTPRCARRPSSSRECGPPGPPGRRALSRCRAPPHRSSANPCQIRTWCHSRRAAYR